MIDTNPPIEKRVEKTKEISSGKLFKYKNKIYKYHSCTPAIIHVKDADDKIMDFDVFILVDVKRSTLYMYVVC